MDAAQILSAISDAYLDSSNLNFLDLYLSFSNTKHIFNQLKPSSNNNLGCFKIYVRI